MDVRVRDGVAAAGDATVLRPRLDAPANTLALPAPSPAELGIRQFGTPTRLSAEPGDSRLLLERPDWPNVVGVGVTIGSHGHFPKDVRPSSGRSVVLSRVCTSVCMACLIVKKSRPPDEGRPSRRHRGLKPLSLRADCS